MVLKTTKIDRKHNVDTQRAKVIKRNRYCRVDTHTRLYFSLVCHMDE